MNPVAYLFDGSFPGLLCVVEQARREAVVPDAVCFRGTWTPSLLHDVREVGTDPAQADRLHAALKTLMGREGLRDALYALLSEKPDVCTVIGRCLLMTLDAQRDIRGRHADPLVRRWREAARFTGLEAHRYKGLLRFRELQDGILLAPFEPRADVLALVALHFRRRLAGECWMVVDLGRGTAAWGQNGRMRLLAAAEWQQRIAGGMDALSRLPPSEREWQALWCAFFRNIAIAGRRNPRQQRANLPERYWRFLVETPGG